MINQEKTLELVDRTNGKTQQHLPSWSPNFSQWYSGLPSGCFVTKTKPGT